MEANMAGDDASLDAAVAIIAKKITPEDVGKAPQQERRDVRENRTDRDVTEMDDYHDLHDLEQLEAAEQRAKQGDEPKPQGDAEGEEGQEAAADDDAILFELPPAEEGKEPEGISRKEALEAVQKYRQMNGDIATAVIRAQDEEYAKQDRVTQQLAETFRTVSQQAKAAMQIMHKFAPPQPDPIMLDRNSGYYNPEGYYADKAAYDSYVAHYNQIAATLKSADQGSKAVEGQVDSEFVRRETERAAKFIPEFADDKTREAKKAEISAALKRDYGLNDSDLADIVDHKAWRMLNDLVKLKAERGKAPEVRKHLQESKPKITNGRLPERDKSSGRFIGEARKAHKEQGTEDSLARLLLSSGALKGL